MKKRTLTGLLMAGALGCMMLSGCGEKKIDLSDYVQASFSGINMKGKAEVSLNYEAITSAISGKLSLSNLSDAAELAYSLGVTPNQSEYLKNGDEISIACKYDNEIAKKFGIRFTYSEQKVKVSGLTEAKAISGEELLDKAKVVYEGVSPYAEAYVEVEDNPYAEFVRYYLDKTYDIKEGDELQLTVEVDEYTAESMGYVVIGDDLTKTIPVDALPAYAVIYDEVNADDLTAIKNQANDVLEAWKAQNSSSWTSYSGETPLRTVFLCSKTDDNYTRNQVIFIYQLTATSRDKETAYYIGVGLENIIKNADGTNSYSLNDIKIFGRAEGYTELYNDLVKSKVAEYTVSEYEY